MNSKELMTNSNNFTFTITDEDQDNNVLDLNAQNIIFSICCYVMVRGLKRQRSAS